MLEIWKSRTTPFHSYGNGMVQFYHANNDPFLPKEKVVSRIGMNTLDA